MSLKNLFNRKRVSLSIGLVSIFVFAPAALAQKYRQTNLVSDIPQLAAVTDPNLGNPWGIARSATSPWWVADNATGVSTLYNGSGQRFPTNSPLVVTVPPHLGGSEAGTPTGIVFNGSSDFEVATGHPARFIFVTLDGTISGWNPSADPTNAIKKVDNSSSLAIYTGAAIASMGGASRLYVANFHSGKLEVFDTHFNPVTLPAGAFTDSDLPPDFAPFNVQTINGSVFVAQNRMKIGKRKSPVLGLVL